MALEKPKQPADTIDDSSSPSFLGRRVFALLSRAALFSCLLKPIGTYWTLQEITVSPDQGYKRPVSGADGQPSSGRGMYYFLLPLTVVFKGSVVRKVFHSFDKPLCRLKRIFVFPGNANRLALNLGLHLDA